MEDGIKCDLPIAALAFLYPEKQMSKSLILSSLEVRKEQLTYTALLLQVFKRQAKCSQTYLSFDGQAGLIFYTKAPTWWN